MPLPDQEMTALDIIVQYNFLIECRDKGYNTEDKRQEIVRGFSAKNHDLINYYLARLDDHFKDTSQHLEGLKPVKMLDTVDGIADKIIEDLSPEERAKISKLPENALEPLQMALGLYSKKQLEERPDDENVQDLGGAYAPADIVKRVWEKLRDDD